MSHYKSFYILIIMMMFFCVVKHADADVIINEIAWMGTSVSTNDEWIELYNNGTSSVILDGWTLKSSDGSPSINLSGTISASGFMLLERTDDTTVPGVTAGVIYSGAMSNTGENFTLTNNTEQVIDRVDMSSGWIAGNATTKETMQKKGSGWITGIATPGSQNIVTDSTPTHSDDPDTSPETVSADDEKETTIKIIPDPVYSSKMNTPDIFVQQVPLKFSSAVKKDGTLNDLHGRFEWSMGDGGSFAFNKSTPFTYTYQIPGQYVVLLRYYSDDFSEEPSTIHKKTITVIPAMVDLSVNNGNIVLTNKSTDDLNLQQWKLQSGIQSFIFPIDTILTKNNTITIPNSVHKLSAVGIFKPSLLTPTGFVASNNSTQISHSYQTSSNTLPGAATEIISDNDPSVELNLFESINSIPTSAHKINFEAALWVIVFMLLLGFSTIGFHFLTRKIEVSPDGKQLAQK